MFFKQLKSYIAGQTLELPLAEWLDMDKKIQRTSAIFINQGVSVFCIIIVGRINYEL